MTNGIFFIIITEYCNAAIACNGQGTCQESGDCQCKPNYYGSDCSSKLPHFCLLRFKKITTAYLVFQSLIVLLMEHAQIKELAMIQQEPVFAIKDLKEQFVKVCN